MSAAVRSAVAAKAAALGAVHGSTPCGTIRAMASKPIRPALRSASLAAAARVAPQPNAEAAAPYVCGPSALRAAPRP